MSFVILHSTRIFNFPRLFINNYIRVYKHFFSKEILILHSVWKLVNTWDGIWEKYKTTKFRSVQVSDVKVTVDAFFDRFNSVVDELKNKKWEVIETTRNNIDEFRYLLPVVDNLKNPAMKVRHWDEIRNLMNK